MNKNKPELATRAVHSARHPADQYGMVNTPVYHGSTVIHPTVEALQQCKHIYNNKDALVYGRFGTPTTFDFENAIADLESGYGAVSVSSGLAAITTAILAFTKSGDHVLMADSVYYPTRHFCDNGLSRYGIDVSYYDPMVGAQIDSLIKPNTKVIFMESPGSHTFEVQDVPAIAKIAREKGITSIIDNSWASPVFFRPLEHGVNVSVIAATKYIVGHSDAMLGVIVTDEEHYQPVRNCRGLYGQCSGPDDLYLGLRGLRTLQTRMQQHDKHGRQVAQWLREHPAVKRVLHPAFDGCPGHEFWQRDFEGASGLFAFELEARTEDALGSMLNNMQLFAMGFSWGGFESLLIPGDPTGSRSATEWTSGNQLFRIHVGLESVDDLIDDLDKGIERYLSA